MSNTLSLFYQATYGYMGTAYNNPQTVPAVTPTGTDQFMLHMIGLGFNLGRGQDADKDGVSDTKDKCPNTLAGVKVDDAGCPLDKDVDGTPDYLDKCPDIIGSQNTAGCPDTDTAGVHDGIDKCITIPGTMANLGCPEIKKETKQLFQKALQGIQFETGKAKIKPVSYPILNAIAKVMSDNPSYKLLIGGHTDNVGADEMNRTLSQDRATAVSNYLIEKGVSPMRLSATGYGETKPVDTNDSVKGRTRNRRVEFNVEFLQ